MLTVFFMLPFFFVGVIAFLFCAAIRPLRRFAFSAALWFVALLPATLGSLLLIGLAKAATGKITLSKGLYMQSLSHLLQSRTIGIATMSGTVLAIIVFASIAAILHQTLIHRITLALFRIYVAGVAFGIGLLLGLLVAVGVGMADIVISHSWFIFLTFTLVAATGISLLCYRYASSFRGSYPQNFPIVTFEEFGTTGG